MGKRGNKHRFVSLKDAEEQNTSAEENAELLTTSSSTSLAEASHLFWKALKKEDIDQLTSLLQRNPDTCSSSSSLSHDTCTSYAGAILNQCGVKKALPLVYAVQEGLSVPCVQLLLQAGASVNKVDESNSQQSALHAACWNEDECMVPLLLCAGADIRVKDGNGRTPLHILASSSSAVSVMKYILTFLNFPSSLEIQPQEAEVKNRGESDNNISVSAHGLKGLQLDPLEVLSIPDQYGMTPVHIAVGEVSQRKPNFMAVFLFSLLEKEWKKEDEKKKKDGERNECYLSPRQETIKKLLSSCAHDGNTVMHVLFSGQSDDKEFSELQTMLKLFNTMLKFNTAHLVGVPNAKGETPLHLALYSIGELNSSKVEDTAKQLFSLLFFSVVTPSRELLEWVDSKDTVLKVSFSSSLTENFFCLQKLLTRLNAEGMVWVQVAIIQHCSAALSALEALLTSVSSNSEEVNDQNVENFKQVTLRDVVSGEGDRTGEILASELAYYSREPRKRARGGISFAVLTKIKETALRLGVVEKDELEEMVSLFEMESEGEEDKEEGKVFESVSYNSSLETACEAEKSSLSVAIRNTGMVKKSFAPKRELRGAYSSRIQRARKGRALRINVAQKERELLKEEESTEQGGVESHAEVSKNSTRLQINGSNSGKRTKERPSSRWLGSEGKDSIKMESTSQGTALEAEGKKSYSINLIMAIIFLLIIVGLAVFSRE